MARRKLTVRRPIEDPRLHAAVIRTTVLAGLAEFADEQGIVCDGWFVGLRLTRAQMSDPEVRVSYRQASQIVRRALRAFPARDLGLELGRRQSIGNFGVLGLAIITARTFGEGIRIGVEYARVAGGLMDLELESPTPGEVAMTARMPEPDAELEPFCCEELFASSLMLARAMAGDPGFVPLRLELAYPAPDYAAEYAALFGCPVRFDMPRNRLAIDERWMALPLASYNAVNAQQALALCRQQMPARDPPGETVASVERLLRARLQDGPTLAQVANTLHLTERTLRRQLTAADTSFKAIHDRVRTERARELLRARNTTIAQVGAALGFKDAREFRRAFKRWTGAAPRDVRARG